MTEYTNGEGRLFPVRVSSSAGSTQSLLLRLGDLFDSPLQSRYEVILRLTESDIALSISRLQKDGAPANQNLIARVAWAIAFNLHGPDPYRDHPGRRQTIKAYSDRWKPETEWQVFWQVFSTDFQKGETGPGLLEDLILSVACEERTDWRHPSDAVTNPAPEVAFDYLYRRDREKVLSDIVHAFGERAGNPEHIANEAWSRVFCDYWSKTARRRFLGLCRISTLVCQVARYVAIDVLRAQGQESAATDSLDGMDLDKVATSALLSQYHAVHDLQLKRGLQDCLTALPARQRIVAELIWLKEFESKQVAEQLRISESAISQLLTKARNRVRNCLTSKGILKIS